jgi:hypothetical protein
MSIEMHHVDVDVVTASGRLRAAAHSGAAPDILHLAELVPVVRQRFELAETFPDDAILASLRMITAASHTRDRWRAAFTSNLGLALAREGRDLATAFDTLLALLPRLTS